MALGWRKEYFRYRSFFLNVYTLYKQRPDIKAYLEIVLSLATVSIFGLFALRPTVLTITELLREIEAKEQTIDALEAKINALNTAQSLYFQNENQISLLDSVVPSSPSPEDFVRQLEGLAGATGVQILGISVEEAVLFGKVETPKKPQKGFTPLPGEAQGLPFSLSVRGSFNSLLSFLTEMENLRRPVKIDAAAINSTKSGETQILVLVIGGRTPYLRDE